METSLQQLGQVVVFSSTDETWDVVTGERARARVQVIQQQPERIRVELYDREFGLGQFRTVHFLNVSADTEPRHGQIVACRRRYRSSFASSFTTYFGLFKE